MSAVVALATQGGPRVLAVAIAFVGGLKFVKWAAEFVCSRLDKRAAYLAELELVVNRRFNDRLKHVEMELDRFRWATMKLVNALAVKDPANPVLTEVASFLSKATPIVPPDQDLDELAARAEGALNSRGE